MTGHHFAIFDTAIGRCGIVWGERGINAVQLPMSNEDKTRARIRQRHGDIAEAPPPAEVQSAIEGIVELLAGKPNDLRDVIPVRSWCRAIACLPPAASRADFPPMAASPPSSRCWRSRVLTSITRRRCSTEPPLISAWAACAVPPLP